MNEDVDVHGGINSIGGCDEVNELCDGIGEVILLVSVSDIAQARKEDTHMYIKEEEDCRKMGERNAKAFYWCIARTVPELKRDESAIKY
jgi:hypothetical protein